MKAGRFQLVDIKTAAEYLGISHRSIYNAIHAGTFPIKVRRIGKKIKFDMSDLDSYIEGSAKNEE